MKGKISEADCNVVFQAIVQAGERGLTRREIKKHVFNGRDTSKLEGILKKLIRNGFVVNKNIGRQGIKAVYISLYKINQGNKKLVKNYKIINRLALQDYREEDKEKWYWLVLEVFEEANISLTMSDIEQILEDKNFKGQDLLAGLSEDYIKKRIQKAIDSLVEEGMIVVDKDIKVAKGEGVYWRLA